MTLSKKKNRDFWPFLILLGINSYSGFGDTSMNYVCIDV